MQELFKNLMNLDQPILTQKLGPIIAPYARIVYLIVLVILGISTFGTLELLLVNPFAFIGAIFLILVEFVIIRMFCEYLTSSSK